MCMSRNVSSESKNSGVLAIEATEQTLGPEGPHKHQDLLTGSGDLERIHVVIRCNSCNYTYK